MNISKFLVDSGAAKVGMFTLASGKVTKNYIDVKKAACNPVFLNHVAHKIDQLSDAGDLYSGVELGAVPLIVSASLVSAKPYLIVRKEIKNYGTKNRIEGNYSWGQQTILLEDVTTTGNTAIEAINLLAKNGVVTIKVISVVDRQSGAKEKFDKLSIPFYSLTTLDEILSHSK